jgi:hypothetical protein
MHVAAGALQEVNRPGYDAYTPLDYTLIFNRPNIAEFLLYLGAKVRNPLPYAIVPSWIHQLVMKCKGVMYSTIILKGILRKRFKENIPKDIANLIVLYFWNMRLK